MAAFTSIIAASALAVGTAVQAKNQREATEQAKRRAKDQETRAIEAAKLRGQNVQQARIQVGSKDAVLGEDEKSTQKGTSKRRNKSVFGLDGSNIGGL